MDIILASKSPRRKELLSQIGLEFRVEVSAVEEKPSTDIPDLMVEELSRQKAESVLAGLGDKAEETLVIGADTVVACDGRILGKPRDMEEAISMLGSLQNRCHEVYTGVTLIYSKADGQQEEKTFHEMTKVYFYPMDKREIADYVATKDPLDKAGAYGIQGLCARYISRIEGDYNNVVGLPVARLYQEAKEWLPDISANISPAKKLVIFDLDGTLSDSIYSIKYCADKALASFGYGPFDVEQYKYFVGDGAANLIKRALIAGGDSQLTQFDKAFALYKDIFRENCMYQVKPYSGIPELLRALKKKGIAIAVLSNKPHAETINVIETLFGKGYFDIIQGQMDGVAIKPSPQGVFCILEQLGLKPQDTLYLGDTSTDMKTGKGAGLFTIGALWGFRDREELEENHADAIIEYPLEVLDYVN